MSTADPKPAFGSGIDAGVIHSVYARTGRVHIPGILTAKSAQRALQSLEKELPWKLHFNTADKVYDLDPAQYKALPDDGREALNKAIHTRAARDFQYLFENFPVSDSLQVAQFKKFYVMRIYDFLNSPAFLKFARQITGVKEISLVDAQATRYQPGHFLTCHDDKVSDKQRVAAYVLNLSPEWRADWGGILHFIDDDGHIAEGYVPSFNALNIFSVPQKHAVSCVSPFAPSARLSISGWFRVS